MQESEGDDKDSQLGGGGTALWGEQSEYTLLGQHLSRHEGGEAMSVYLSGMHSREWEGVFLAWQSNARKVVKSGEPHDVLLVTEHKAVVSLGTPS